MVNVPDGNITFGNPISNSFSMGKQTQYILELLVMFVLAY